MFDMFHPHSGRGNVPSIGKSRKMCPHSLKGSHTEEGQERFLIIPEYRTSNNGFKLQKPRSKLNIRKNFITVTAVQEWNQLPWEVVSVPALEALKRKLDNHLSDLFGLGFLH